jgi:5-methylcytosine-specific restriction endonuclease McrA
MFGSGQIDYIIARCLYIKTKQKKNANNKRIQNGLRRNIYINDCKKCKKCNSKNNLSVDHIFPISKGGVKAKFNLQTLCFNCNTLKGDEIIDLGVYIKIK